MSKKQELFISSTHVWAVWVEKRVKRSWFKTLMDEGRIVTLGIHTFDENTPPAEEQ